MDLNKLRGFMKTKFGIALVSLAIIGAASGSVIYFETGHGTIGVHTGTESFMQTVYFNSTNANLSTESLQILSQNGNLTNVSAATPMFMVAQGNSGVNGGAYDLQVANLTQGEYIILTVAIKNTGSGDIPFAGYSQLNYTETGTPYYETSTFNSLSWNNGNNSGAVQGYYPTSSLYMIYQDNASWLGNLGQNGNPPSNQTIWLLVSGPQSGPGSNTTNPYPAQLMPGQTVYYNIVLGLGSYAPASYLNQSYSFTFSVGGV